MQGTSHTVVHVDSFQDTISGYCLLWRGESDKDSAGNWYTANSNLALKEMVGSPVVINHPELGPQPMEIGNVTEVSPDYYGIHITAQLKPVRLISVALSLMMTQELNLAPATDLLDEVEIGEDGYVLKYPITAVIVTDMPPPMGQP